MKKIFNTTQSDLLKYNGTQVEVIRLMTEDEYDKADIGNMYKIIFPDGKESDAFEDELSNIKMQSWLVYEINDVCNALIPQCSISDMKVFDTKEEALDEMKKRKELIISDNGCWKLSDETEICMKFNDISQKGSFDIRLIQLA